MSLRLKNNDNRLESLRQSLEDSGSGGVTLHFAKLMANAPGHQPAQCKIIGYYRTFLFEYPLANLVEAFDDYANRHRRYGARINKTKSRASY